MTKPFLVSIFSYTAGVRDYLNTLFKLGDSAIVKMVCQDVYAGNRDRWLHFPTDFKDDDMIIFTDSGDVIFQTPLPNLEQKIYACPEFDTWGLPNYWLARTTALNFHELDGEAMFNCGTWVMPYKKVKELLVFYNEHLNEFPPDIGDTLIFDWWLKTQEYEIHPTLMTCLYNSVATKNTIKTDRGWVNPKGELFSIVHANGNSKELS